MNWAWALIILFPRSETTTNSVKKIPQFFVVAVVTVFAIFFFALHNTEWVFSVAFFFININGKLKIIEPLCVWWLSIYPNEMRMKNSVQLNCDSLKFPLHKISISILHKPPYPHTLFHHIERIYMNFFLGASATHARTHEKKKYAQPQTSANSQQFDVITF